MRLIAGSIIFLILVIIGNYLAKKEFKKKDPTPPDEMYPLF